MRLKLYRGKWAAVGRAADGTPWRRSLRTSDRAEAERRFRDIKFETPGDSVADAVALYLEEKRTQEARSYQSMLTAWRALEPTFGHLRPDQIDRKLCRTYATARKRAGVQNGTIIKDLGVLKAALRWSGKAAGAVFDMPPAPPPRDRYITREEHMRLVEVCDLPHVRLFVVLAWATGARASALLEMTWDQIDFEKGQIRLGKGGARRKGRATVPMTAQARTTLTDSHNVRTCDFVIEWGGKPVKSLKRSFAEACRIAGLEEVTPHVLRHSAAVRMIEDGVPLEMVGQFLGHTDLRVTYRVYARFSPDALKRAAKALE